MLLALAFRPNPTIQHDPNPNIRDYARVGAWHIYHRGGDNSCTVERFARDGILSVRFAYGKAYVLIYKDSWSIPQNGRNGMFTDRGSLVDSIFIDQIQINGMNIRQFGYARPNVNGMLTEIPARTFIARFRAGRQLKYSAKAEDDYNLDYGWQEGVIPLDGAAVALTKLQECDRRIINRGRL